MINDIDKMDVYSKKLILQMRVLCNVDKSTAEIAQELGVTKKTVYNYINGKSVKSKNTARFLSLTLSLLAYMHALRHDKSTTNREKLNNFIVDYGLFDIDVEDLRQFYHNRKLFYEKKNNE